MRGLILAPTYPISAQKLIGTWAHQQAKALERAGATVEVVSPVPKVCRFPGCSERIQRWATVPKRTTLDDIPVHYPRTLSYPVAPIKRVYSRIPQLEGWLTWYPLKSYLTHLVESKVYDFIIAHNPVPAGYLGSKLAERFDVVLAVIFHSYTELDAAENNQSLRTMFSDVASKADLIITVSEMMRKKLRPIHTGDITIIRNGFDPDEVEKTLSSESTLHLLDEDRKLILSIGSMTRRKGHVYLLQAVKRLVRKGDFKPNELHCLLVGSGPEEERLREFVRQNNLEDCISFRSGLDRTEVNHLMQAADAFVLPSWNEPCATVFSETMAYGTPMVMVDGEGFSELVTHGETGLLVPPRDSQSIAEVLKDVLTDPELAARLQRQSKQFAYDWLSWDQNASSLISALEVVSSVD